MTDNIKTALHGKTYYYDCGYLCESLTLVATFDNLELAEKYVIDSIIKIFDKDENHGYDAYEFKENSLLRGYQSFETDINFILPHNPTI